MSAPVLVCGAVFDGISEELRGRTEILVRGDLIAEIGDSVDRPDGAEVIDLSERTVSPGFIDTHVHLTMDASTLAQQTLESSAAKALNGLSLAREYLSYGFTTLRDLGSMDPEFPILCAVGERGNRQIPPRRIEVPQVAMAGRGADDVGGDDQPRALYEPGVNGERRRLLQRRRRPGLPDLVRR